MQQARAEHRLAAVLAADVAGYSRLIGADEEGTLGCLKAIRAHLVDSKIAEHRGRIVKTTGDGLLVEFSSVVDAVRCATEVQAGMAERNASVPVSQRIEWRVGINVGDIVVENGDIFGDGVNIAARLEGLADPGGICVSARAQEDAAGKLDVAFDDMGEQQLHNIARPVRVYRVGAGAAARPTLPLPDKPSIAVLAFTNMSGDPEQEFFADGIAEDIITALSKSRSWFVIARNSSFTYKGKSVVVKDVGRELGVRYVLEGRVRKAANRVRVTAQLVEAATGGHLWAERYDRDLADIFAVQDEITASVSAAIQPALDRRERGRAARKPPESLDAWECYHRGMWHFANAEAREFDKARSSSGARSSSTRDLPRPMPYSPRPISWRVCTSGLICDRKMFREHSITRDMPSRSTRRMRPRMPRLRERWWCLGGTRKAASRRTLPSASIPIPHRHMARKALHAAGEAGRARRSSHCGPQCGSVRSIR